MLKQNAHKVQVSYEISLSSKVHFLSYFLSDKSDMRINCLSAINEENQNYLGWLFSNFVVFDSSTNYEQNVNFLGWLLSNFLVSDSSGSTVQHYIVCEISIIRQLASVAEWLRHPTLNSGVSGSTPMENFFFFHFDIPATRPRHPGLFLVSNKWT